MSDLLHRIVADIGGEVSDGGKRALCPGPGHTIKDRSMSLLLTSRGLVVNSWSPKTDWQECRRWLEERGHVDAFCKTASTADARPRGPRAKLQPRTYDPRKIAYAKRLWDQGLPTEGTLVARYHERRGLDAAMAASSQVRFAPQCDHRAYGTLRGRPTTSPAMICRITAPDGAICGIHKTYLDPQTEYRRVEGPIRQILGRLMGGAIRLHQSDRRLLVAEGYETTQSASRRFDTPAWCLLSAANFYEWLPPRGVEELLIAGDPGIQGVAAANTLADRVRAMGVAVRICVPDGPYDWNALDTRCG